MAFASKPDQMYTTTTKSNHINDNLEYDENYENDDDERSNCIADPKWIPSLRIIATREGFAGAVIQKGEARFGLVFYFDFGLV